MYESIFRRAVRRLILVMRLSTLQPNRHHMNEMLGGWTNKRRRVDSSYMPGMWSPYNAVRRPRYINGLGPPTMMTDEEWEAYDGPVYR